MHPYTFHVSVDIPFISKIVKNVIYMLERLRPLKYLFFNFYLINLNIFYSKNVFDPYQLVAFCTSWSLNIDVQESIITLVINVSFTVNVYHTINGI